jgi:hypothetical protein
MTRANRNVALAVLLAAGTLAGVGCGAQNSCSNVTPDVNQAPTACSFAPSQQVSVNVRWCSCNSSVTCDVAYDSGTYVLDPKISSCDASCPSNPSDCPFDVVSCTLTTQALGSINDYNILIHGASGDASATMTVSDSGSTSCGPT